MDPFLHYSHYVAFNFNPVTAFRILLPALLNDAPIGWKLAGIVGGVLKYGVFDDWSG